MMPGTLSLPNIINPGRFSIEKLPGFVERWKSGVFMFEDKNAAALSSTLVARWDGSRSRKQLVQATALLEPAYAVVNGYGGAVFDGVSHYLDGTSGLAGLTRLQSGFTSIMVVNPSASVAAAERYLAISRNAVQSNRFSVFNNTGSFYSHGSRRLDADTSFSTSTSAACTGGTPVVRIDTVDWLTGKVRIYINGTSVVNETASWTAGGITSDTDSSEVLVSHSVLPGGFSLYDLSLIQWTISEEDAKRASSLLMNQDYKGLGFA